MSAVITYDVMVDNIEEDLLLDATMMHYAGIQLKDNTQEFIHKDKIVRGSPESAEGSARPDNLHCRETCGFSKGPDSLFQGELESGYQSITDRWLRNNPSWLPGLYVNRTKQRATS